MENKNRTTVGSIGSDPREITTYVEKYIGYGFGFCRFYRFWYLLFPDSKNLQKYCPSPDPIGSTRFRFRYRFRPVPRSKCLSLTPTNKKIVKWDYQMWLDVHFYENISTIGDWTPLKVCPTVRHSFTR